MQIVHTSAECPRPATGSVITIGAYDGVHRGHQAVIRRVGELAEPGGLHTAVVTFDPHPASVVRPESAPRLLTDLSQRLELLELAGVDTTVIVSFDVEAAAEPAEEFVRRVVVDCLAARHVVVGADFHFGKGREGNVEFLAEMGRAHGFEVDGLHLVGPDLRPASDEERVSSTAVRVLLAEGDIAGANELLGRRFEVRGTVEQGDQRGRELGFPTANVSLPDEIRIPGDGVYAAWYQRPSGEMHPAAISIGRRPTFYIDQEKSLVEAHLLGGFTGDLYGERAHVHFVGRLRSIVAFDGPAALVEQLQRDCAAAEEMLGADPAEG